MPSNKSTGNSGWSKDTLTRANSVGRNLLQNVCMNLQNYAHVQTLPYLLKTPPHHHYASCTKSDWEVYHRTTVRLKLDLCYPMKAASQFPISSLHFLSPSHNEPANPCQEYTAQKWDEEKTKNERKKDLGEQNFRGSNQREASFNHSYNKHCELLLCIKCSINCPILSSLIFTTNM
jgi:hypothetical protein